jgi:hypothetical protein
MDISDIMVHFNNHIQATQRDNVENTLRAMDGVIAPRFVANKEQFLIVAYDPAKVQTGHFMKTFHDMGLEARFVGL